MHYDSNAKIIGELREMARVELNLSRSANSSRQIMHKVRAQAFLDALAIVRKSSNIKKAESND